MKHTTKTIFIIVLAAGLGACSGMTRTETDTLIGAAAGGVIGNAVTGGSAVGTIGGAAVGGVIGHEVGEGGQDRRRRY